MGWDGKDIEKTFNYEYFDRFRFEDESNRSIWLNREIDDDSIDEIVYSIMRYNRIDAENRVDIEDRKPIKLYINTPGGMVSSGYSIVDAIMMSKTPVYTINVGTCYSMGFLVYIAGDIRFAMPHSTFLMHDGSTFSYDSLNKVKDRLDFEAEEIGEHTKNLILSKTNISEELYNEKLRIEWYLYASTAKEYGIVDYIIGEEYDIDYIL